jgi:hypothetical protein
MDTIVVCSEWIRALHNQATPDPGGQSRALLPMEVTMETAQNATKVRPAKPEFTRRAATAWIRAADAGLIDAGELTWLLAHLPADPE